MFRCPFCGRWQHTARRLERHVRHLHLSVVSCAQCDFKCNSPFNKVNRSDLFPRTHFHPTSLHCLKFHIFHPSVHYTICTTTKPSTCVYAFETGFKSCISKCHAICPEGLARGTCPPSRLYPKPNLPKWTVPFSNTAPPGNIENLISEAEESYAYQRL